MIHLYFFRKSVSVTNFNLKNSLIKGNDMISPHLRKSFTDFNNKQKFPESKAIL